MEVSVATDAATIPNGWLSPSQAALRLERSAQWVRDLADRGVLNAVRTPLGRLIDPASIDAMLRNRKINE